LTSAFSAPFWYLTRLGGNPLYMYALMWAPGLGAIVTLRMTGGSLTDLGLRPVPLKWLFRSWLTILALTAVLTVALLATGVVGYPNPAFVAEQTQKLRLPEGSSPGLVTL